MTGLEASLASLSCHLHCGAQVLKGLPTPCETLPFDLTRGGETDLQTLLCTMGQNLSPGS